MHTSGRMEALRRSIFFSAVRNSWCAQFLQSSVTLVCATSGGKLQARLRKAIFESVILAGSDFHRSKQLTTGCAVMQFSSGGSLRLANDYFLNYQLLGLYFFVFLCEI